MKNIILFLLLSLGLFAEDVSSQMEEQVSVEKEEKAPFIAVSAIPENAVKTIIELKKIKEAIKEDKKIVEMQSLVKPYADSLKDFLNSPNYQDFSHSNARDLQKMQSEIAIYLKQLQEWESTLKSQIKIYDENRVILKDYSALWAQTHIHSLEEVAPPAIMEHITSVIVNVEEVSNDLKAKYDRTLVNSQVVTTDILNLREVDASLIKQEEVVKNKIFYQNEPFLFSALADQGLSPFGFFAGVYEILVEKYKEVMAYVQTNPSSQLNLAIASFIMMIFIAYFHYLYRRRRLFVREESFEKKAFYFLGRPISTFFVLVLLVSVAVFSDRPKSFMEMILILTMIPVARILWSVLDKQYRKYVYSFFIIYVLYLLDKNSVGFELERRIGMLFVEGALLVYIFKVLKNRVFDFMLYELMRKTANVVFVIYAVFLILAMASDIYGSILLSNRIIDGVFTTLYSSIVFYSIYVILTGYVVILLRRRMSSASNALDIYAKKIEGSIRVLIKIWMVAWWALIVSKIVGAYPFIIEFRDDVLAFSWQIADVTISIQSIFDFSIIVVGTWFIARFTKTILEIEVFARFTLPRGVPTAILTTLNYIIVISGTIIAFSSLGVSAQQFALIFGALGVGIGFGLRNIIANFVSGVIMVFERPVQIGDTIEVDGTMGGVQSIGARSSVIKTFDGSEVIIPNADFIAKEIVNWTLSNEYRRKTLEFKVALGSDIDEVLEIMKDVSQNHSDVLKDPEPLATFKNFDEYYLRFKLYYWLSDNLIVAQSEIAIEVYRRLKKAGIAMPIPKVEHDGR